MREICTSGSEGGVAQANAPSLPLSSLPSSSLEAFFGLTRSPDSLRSGELPQEPNETRFSQGDRNCRWSGRPSTWTTAVAYDHASGSAVRSTTGVRSAAMANAWGRSMWRRMFR